MSTFQPQRPNRPAVTLTSSQEAALSARTARLGERAQSLLEHVRAYDRLDQIGAGLGKRLEVVDRLITTLTDQQHGDQSTAQVILNTSSRWDGVRFRAWQPSGAESVERRIKFFEGLKCGLINDQNNNPILRKQAARQVKLAIKNTLVDLDHFINLESAGIYSLNNHPEWQGMGNLYAAAAAMMKGDVPLDKAMLYELSERLFTLSYAVEYAFDFTCSRKDASFHGSSQARDGTLTSGWRLGLPIPQGALIVSVEEKDGVELLSYSAPLEDASASGFEDECWRDSNEQLDDREDKPRLGRGLVATRQIVIPRVGKAAMCDVELGQLQYHRFGNVFEIHSIIVDESARGQAIGTQLMNAFLGDVVKHTPPCAVFTDVPTRATAGSGYQYPSMDRFLTSYGFRWVSGAAEGFARYEWAREFAEPLLRSRV